MEGNVIISQLSTGDLLAQFRAIVEEVVDKRLQAMAAEKWLSIQEACALLDITRPTLDNYVNAGHLRKHRLGNTIRLKNSEVMYALNKIKPYYKWRGKVKQG
jgi:excisionase family DNA binding protein